MPRATLGINLFWGVLLHFFYLVVKIYHSDPFCVRLGPLAPNSRQVGALVLLGWRCRGCNEQVGNTSKVRNVMRWGAGSPCSDSGSAPVWAPLGSAYNPVITISLGG